MEKIKQIQKKLSEFKKKSEDEYFLGEAYLDDYIESRNVNLSMYNKLVDKLNDYIKENDFEYDISVSISAKDGTPYVLIQDYHDNSEAYKIKNILNELGFSDLGIEEKPYGTLIYFE